MSLESLKALPQLAPSEVAKILTEVQGLSFTQVAGAAAGTKMNVAALRLEDTLAGVLVGTDAGGAWASDLANCTIQDTRASGTLTVGAVANNDTVTVNGTVYTYKDAPTSIQHVKRTAGDANANAAALSSAINSFEARRISGIGAGNGLANVAQVVASVSTNVVTVTSVADAVGNAPVVTSSNGGRLAVAGSTTASATVTCASALAADTVTVNGTVFTIRAALVNQNPLPKYGQKTVLTDALIGGNDTATALSLANAINYFERVNGTLDVVAAPAAAVVTLTPRTAKKGNIIDIAAGQGTVVASGAALAGGTATGGIKSTTNLTGKSLFVAWFNKK